MATVGPITPPYNPNDQTPSTDQPVANTYTPEQELNDRLAWAQNHKQDLGDLLAALDSQAKTLPKSMAWAANTFGWILHGLFTWEVEWKGAYFNAIKNVVLEILPDAEVLMGEVFAAEFPVFEQVISSAVTPNVEYGSGAMADIAEIIFESMVQPFSMMGNAMDPTQLGSGIANQQYLLSQSLGLAVATWAIDSMQQLAGGGLLKTLWPIMAMIQQAVNPYNAVRMAMEYGYRFMIQQPLVRDMNHAYPIKDLGLSALAKLYVRGEIDEETYLSRCLDSGLDNTQASQLVLESSKMLAESDVVKLHQMKIMSDDDVLKYLAQQGYRPGDAAAKLYLLNHERYFTIQARVGTEAVTAWKHGYITQAQLEEILQQMGYTAEETALLEIEGQFLKHQIDLDYSQVRDLFKAGIVGIDYVTEYLSNYKGIGYTGEQVNQLILLDFTQAEKATIQADELIARLRVEEQTALEQAAVDANKNETDLAKAKKALAKAEDQAAKDLGALQTASGIAALLG